MSRKKRYLLRNMLHTIDMALPKPRARATERERDLISVASVALWDGNFKVFARAVRRMATPAAVAVFEALREPEAVEVVETSLEAA